MKKAGFTYKLFFAALPLLLSVQSFAQLNKVIDVETAGSLPQLVDPSEKYQITDLSLSGNLNGTDIRYIREMAGSDHMQQKTNGKLTTLDLSKARIVEGGDYYYFYQSREEEYYTSQDMIGDYMFAKCNLESIRLPENSPSIGMETFLDCNKLGRIEWPLRLQSIGLNAFEGTSWYTGQPDGIVYAGPVLYRYKGEMPENTSLEIKDGTVFICLGAFEGFSNLVSVKIPNSVRHIGQIYPFDEETRGYWVAGSFKYCTSLTTVDLGEGLESIGDNTFNRCEELTSITLPSGISQIGSHAFKDCKKLRKIYSLNPTAPVCNGTGYAECFDNVDIQSVELAIPLGSIESYQTTLPWKEFGHLVEYFTDGARAYFASSSQKGTGGTILINGAEIKTDTLRAGEKVTFEIIAAKGGSIKSAYLNKVDITSEISDNKYTLDAIKEDLVLEVAFENHSSITDLPGDTRIYTASGKVTIENAPDGSFILIRNPLGQTVYTGIETEIFLDGGIYLITVGHTTQKIIIE